MEITLYNTGVLKGKSILHEEVTIDLSPKISVVADDVAFDHGLLADNNLCLGENPSFESTVNPYVIRGSDLSFYYRTG